MVSSQEGRAYPQLSKPPLREALIDIRLADALPDTFLRVLDAQALKGYENPQPIRHGQFKFTIPPDSEAQAAITKDELVGRRYQSPDQSRVVQFRRDGLTFSVLRGYTNWDELRTHTESAWKQFVSLAGDVRVGRIAVRYINVLDLPEIGDFDTYLTAGPRIPAGLPQLLMSFFNRVAIPFDSAKALAIVTQASEPVPRPGRASVILDIDVYSRASCAKQIRHFTR